MTEPMLFDPPAPPAELTIAVFPGEGASPELVAAALRLLDRIALRGNLRLNIVRGGAIGLDARRAVGADLPDDAVALIDEAFRLGGAVFAGAGGGRFVYDMRQRFGLRLKLNPIRSLRGVARADFDVLVVRETSEGLYHGVSRVEGSGGVRRVIHEISTTWQATRELVDAAARLAAARTGRLAVACKGSGVPAITELWREAAEHAAEAHAIHIECIEIDYAAYRLVREPASFDVVAAPNCFGDILSDLGGLLMGSRGATYGGAFSHDGKAAYQTNHGAAYDLAGKGAANPAGQMLAAAMMLRESFGLVREACWIESAVEAVWLDGWTTADMEPAGGPRRVCGTAEFTARVEAALDRGMDGA